MPGIGVVCQMHQLRRIGHVFEESGNSGIIARMRSAKYSPPTAQRTPIRANCRRDNRPASKRFTSAVSSRFTFSFPGFRKAKRAHICHYQLLSVFREQTSDCVASRRVSNSGIPAGCVFGRPLPIANSCAAMLLEIGLSLR